jgi:hypothetical protein
VGLFVHLFVFIYACNASMEDISFSDVLISPYLWLALCRYPLALGAIVCLFVDLRKAFASAFVFVLMVCGGHSPYMIFRMVDEAEFFALTFPEYYYIHHDCKPINFSQDHKVYSIGFCDDSADKDGATEGSGLVVYDTSDDISVSSYDPIDEAIASIPPRKELVDAERRYFGDNPKASLEIADYDAVKIYGHFYVLNFIFGGGLGFTNIYGPPPYNSKTPYKPDF